MPTDAMREAIVRAAQEQGIDPSLALAVAERESNFDPNAHASKTIHGIFQMTGSARAEHGVGSSSDPYTQAAGWGRYMQGVKKEMSSVLGREPTAAESYLGHHFGGVRAARMMKMDPNTPVSAVFTPYERSLNPHFDKAGTVGNLNSSVTADIERRQAKYGGTIPERYETAAGGGAAPASRPFTPPSTDPTAAAYDTTPAATQQPQQAAMGPNSFKGLPSFDTSTNLQHAPLARPQIPNIAIQGMPAMPTGPQQPMGVQNPQAVMLGQVNADQPAKQVEQAEQQPQPQEQTGLMGIPV